MQKEKKIREEDYMGYAEDIELIPPPREENSPPKKRKFSTSSPILKSFPSPIPVDPKKEDEWELSLLIKECDAWVENGVNLKSQQLLEETEILREKALKHFRKYKSEDLIEATKQKMIKDYSDYHLLHEPLDFDSIAGGDTPTIYQSLVNIKAYNKNIDIIKNKIID